MIHHNSKDPVFIKKITLNIWKLRSEVEAIVRKKLEQNPELAKSKDFEELIQEYTMKNLESQSEESPEGTPDLKVVEEGDEPPPDDDDKRENSNVEVIQRHPDLSNDLIYKARLMLSEISMFSVYFFCESPLTIGQSIVIDFLVPNRFVLNAEITYCRPFNMKSRIISKNKLSYRIAAEFTFLRNGERTLLRNFLKSIKPDISSAQSSSEKDEDGDDFDELDDL